MPPLGEEEMMRLRHLILVLALTFGFAGPVAATPLALGASAVSNDPQVEPVGYGPRHHGWGRGHHYGWRHHGW